MRAKTLTFMNDKSYLYDVFQTHIDLANKSFIVFFAATHKKKFIRLELTCD